VGIDLNELPATRDEQGIRRALAPVGERARVHLVPGFFQWPGQRGCDLRRGQGSLERVWREYKSLSPLEPA
jgi:hypothetical protein